MGSISLTAVNAFGDPRAARQASAHLVDRGYPVVAAGRLDELALRNGLLAIVGAGRDHERMIAISHELHDRIAALAVVGGPLAILIGRHEGLTMPTLVVSDRVGRRQRRSAVRRLPRGSMVVRAANFDAALDAIVAFLDRATEGAPQPVGSSNLRPLALRLAPVAFFAPAAAVMLAGSGADAALACTPSSPGDGLLSITCDGEAVQLILSANDDGVILLNGDPVASLGETQKISILTTGGDDQLTIDDSLGKFTPGSDATPIAFDVDMGDGNDELKWLGSPGHEGFKLTADAIDVPGGENFENKVRGIELLNFDLGAGEDSFDGGSWPFKIELDGGPGKDNLIGGLGPDVIKLSPGGDTIDGSDGVDLLKIDTADSLVKITDETIELPDSANIVGYMKMEALDLVSDKTTPLGVEVNGFHFDKMDFVGSGLGGDSIKLTSGLPAVQVSGDEIKLSNTDDTVLGEIKFAGFDTFKYLGDGSVNKLDLDGVKFSKIYLDGGGGAGDKLTVATNDSLVKISDEAISLNFSKTEIAYKQFTDFGLVSDKTTPLGVEVNGFHFDKMDFVGSGLGGDSIKLTSGLPAVQVSGDEIKLSNTDDTVLGEIKFAGFDTFKYLGDGSVNKLDLDGVKFSKIYLDGGGGAGDKLNVATNDSLVKISDEAISLNFSKIDIKYNQFTDFGLVSDKTTPLDVEVNGFHFDKMDFTGAAGFENSIKLTSKASTVDVGADQIKLSDVAGGQLGEIKFAGFDTFKYLGDGSVNKIDLDPTIKFSKIYLDGGGGAGDKLNVGTGDSLVKITDSAISLNFSKIDIKYNQFTDFGLVSDKTTPLDVEVNGFHFDKMDFTGAAGFENSIKLTSKASTVDVGADQIKLSDVAGGQLGEIKFAGFDTFKYLGDGSVNKIDLDPTIKFSKIYLDGGGGAGDKLNVATNDSLVKISDEAISLNFSKIDIKYNQFTDFGLVSDKTTPLALEVNGFKFTNMDVAGGAVGSSIKLTSGLPAVQVSGGDIKLSNELTLLGDIKYAGFDTFKYLGDGSVNKIDLDPTIKFSKIDLNGGGGAGDKLTVGTGDSLVKISDEAISLNFSKIEIAYKEFSDLGLIGGAADSKLDISSFIGLSKLSLDGGGGIDSIKFSTGESLVKITDSSIAPGALNPIAHTGFEALSVLAVTDVNNTFDGSKVTKLSLTLDGGSKDDILMGGELNDFFTGGLGTNKISGGGGMDTLVESRDGNFVASTSALSGAGVDSFSSIEALNLTGGPGDNTFNTEPFKGPVMLDGGAGNDALTGGASDDVIIGGAGNDSLMGNQGNDRLFGGDGNDTLNGGPGTDFGDGGSGTDTGKNLESPLNIER